MDARDLCVPLERNVVGRFAPDPDAGHRRVEVEDLLLAGAVAVAQEGQTPAPFPDSLAQQRVRAAQLAALGERDAELQQQIRVLGVAARQKRDRALEQVDRRRHVSARQRPPAGSRQPPRAPAGEGDVLVAERSELLAGTGRPARGGSR